MKKKEWAYHCLTAAKRQHADAKRWLESGDAVNWISNKLSTSCYWLMEAWLTHRNIECNGGWPVVRTKFVENAPEPLKSKILHCIVDAGTLDYRLEENCFRDEDEPLIPIDWAQWKKDAFLCCDELSELITIIDKEAVGLKNETR